ncbi:MAG: hypothetical protein AB2L26_06570 [Ignavibacteria bacterium]
MKIEKSRPLKTIVLDLNKYAIDFYDRPGAKHMKNRFYYRYTI